MSNALNTAADKHQGLPGGESPEHRNDADEPSGLGVSRRQLLKGAGAILGASGVQAALGAPTTVLADGDETRLAGTWLETINSPGFAVFQSLFTYDSGGGMVGTATIDSASGLKSSPTQGAWAHESGRTYRWHGLAFSFDDAGNLNGIYDIKETVTLNKAGTSYSGSGAFEIKPAGANPISVPTTPYTVSAVRIGV